MNTSSATTVNQNQTSTSSTCQITSAGQTNITEQFKGLSLQNQQYASVPSLVAGNKENKKQNEGTVASKVALKPREFGRELTNAATSSTQNGVQASKNTHSLIMEQLS